MAQFDRQRFLELRQEIASLQHDNESSVQGAPGNWCPYRDRQADPSKTNVEQF